jgi:hypothetical protein
MMEDNKKEVLKNGRSSLFLLVDVPAACPR